MRDLLRNHSAQDIAWVGLTLPIAAAQVVIDNWGNPSAVIAVLGSLLLVIRAATELVNAIARARSNTSELNRQK